MSKINFKKSEHADIQSFRQVYYQQIIAPLDSMWESLYIQQSTPYLIQLEEIEIGFCCIDSEKSITQAYIQSSHQYLMQAVITQLIKEKLANSAKLSSIEPISFNAALYLSKSIEKDSINYQYIPAQTQQTVANLSLQLGQKADADKLRAYMKEEFGFDDNFGYTDERIERQEIYYLSDSEGVLATGECRLSDSQPRFADIGMSVRANQRGKGVATNVLAQLVQLAKNQNRIPICSTTVGNIAAQKAIVRAGFSPSHIIFRINFDTEN
jgi:predicted acetyltransferase